MNGEPENGRNIELPSTQLGLPRKREVDQMSTTNAIVKNVQLSTKGSQRFIQSFRSWHPQSLQLCKSGQHPHNIQKEASSKSIDISVLILFLIFILGTPSSVEFELHAFKNSNKRIIIRIGLGIC